LQKFAPIHHGGGTLSTEHWAELVYLMGNSWSLSDGIYGVEYGRKIRGSSGGSSAEQGTVYPFELFKQKILVKRRPHRSKGNAYINQDRSSGGIHVTDALKSSILRRSSITF
jgi:hypothetical protein